MSDFLNRLLCANIRVLLLLLGITTSASAACVVSMPVVAFGNVNVLPGAAVDTTSTVTVTCSGGSPRGQRVCISIGAGSANDATSRQMVGPAATRTRYDLYKDAARTQLWGSWQTGYNVSGVQLDVPRNSTRTVTVYARFFGAQQTARPGAYSATFTNNPFIGYRNNNGRPCPFTNNTATTSTSATVTVINSCNVSATNVNFGSSGVLAADRDATGTLTIQCSSTSPYTVGLNGGNSGAANPTLRQMAFGANIVTYGLYRDAARTLPWGATVGVNTASGTGSGLVQNLTVFGRIPPQTTPPPGNYSDTIIATVTY